VAPSEPSPVRRAPNATANGDTSAPIMVRLSGLLWAVVIAVALGLCGAWVWLFAAADRAALPTTDPVAARIALPPHTSRTDPVVIAGSGSNIPVTRLLARAHCASRAGQEPTPGEACEVLVAESIGSAGGVSAAADGTIDVGLISRPLKGPEEALGLTVLPYAQAEVVLAVNAAVPKTEPVDLARFARILRGDDRQWSNGERIAPLVREQGDSTHLIASALSPAFKQANQEALRRGAVRVLYSDRDMCDALRTTPGAVGLTDRGLAVTEALPVTLFPLDPGASQEGRPQKVLAFVLKRGEPGRGAERPAVRAFLDFVKSAEAHAILTAHGYAPIPRTTP
jgi:phosphate transport system substrate-binding protein